MASPPTLNGCPIGLFARPRACGYLSRAHHLLKSTQPLLLSRFLELPILPLLYCVVLAALCVSVRAIVIARLIELTPPIFWLSFFAMFSGSAALGLVLLNFICFLI